jgi:hypothetical protein
MCTEYCVLDFISFVFLSDFAALPASLNYAVTGVLDLSYKTGPLGSVVEITGLTGNNNLVNLHLSPWGMSE